MSKKVITIIKRDGQPDQVKVKADAGLSFNPGANTGDPKRKRILLRKLV